MYKRNNIYYTDFYDENGRRHRVSLQTSKEEDAILREKELKSTIRRVRPERRETLHYKDYKVWYLNFLKNNRAKGTAVIAKLALKYFEEYKKLKYLRDLTPEVLLGFKDFLAAKAAANNGRPGPAGRNRTIRAIKTFIHLAEKTGKIGIKQCWEIVEKDKAEKKHRVVWHNLNELQIIGNVLQNEGDLLTCFLLGWEEGLRRGEMAFLAKSDYNPYNHTITITPKKEWRPKTEKSARTIPLRPATENAIRASIARTPKSPWLINLDGDRLNHDYISHHYRYAIKTKCPFIKSFIHKLRHTYGSLLIQEGVNIKVISDLMGHSSIAQTEQYIHIGQSQYAEAVLKMPQIKF